MQMTLTWKSKALALLSAMHSGQEWDDVQDLYEIVVEELGPEWAMTAVQKAVKTEQWRPAPAQLRQIAARLASPLPNEGDLFQEFWKAVQYGYGQPRWSHAILGEVVRRLGGWEYFRTLRPHLSDLDQRSIWYSRFMDAWKASTPEWTEEVSQQLALPPADRDERYRIGQPATRPAIAAKEPVKAIEAAPLQIRTSDLSSTAMPAAIKERLRMHVIPKVGEPAPALTREEKQRLEEEAVEIAARAARVPTEEEVAAALAQARARRTGS